MAFTKHVWDQLKATTVEQFMSALKRDGFARDTASTGAVLVYIRNERSHNRRVVIHYHPGKTWEAKFLKGLIADAGWTQDDLFRVGLASPISKEHLADTSYLVPCDCDFGIIEGDRPCPQCGGSRFKQVTPPAEP